MLFLSHMAALDVDVMRRVIAQQQGDDALRPVTVVCPNTYAMGSLRQRLGLTGFANLRFITIDILSEWLGSPSLAEKGKRPLTSVFRTAVVRSVAAQAQGVLEGMGTHPSTHAGLRRTFQDLRHASPAALSRLEEGGELPGEVVRLFRKYRADTADYHDNEDRAAAAADAVRDGSASGALDEQGFVVFYHMRRLTPSQRRLVRELAAAGRCAVMLGLTGDADADQATLEFAAELRPAFQAAAGPTASPNGIGDAVDVSDGVALDAMIGNRVGEIITAPDAHQEVRMVIRRIMGLAQGGVPFHRMAILHRQQNPYGTLVREELTLAGIPVAGASATSLADTAVGRTLLGVIRLREEDFSRSAVMEWLTGCPINPPVDAFSPSLWDAISKRALIVGGVEQWGQRLSAFAEENERQADSGIGAGERELSEGETWRLRRDAKTARDMRKYIASLAVDAEPPGNGEPVPHNGWTAFCDWASDLLGKYVNADTLPDAEQRALHKIKSNLDDLAAADHIPSQPPLKPDDFRRALSEMLRAQVGHLDAVGKGVFVAPLQRASAMDFGAVYVVGMVEGAMPSAMRDNPLVPDDARRNAGGAAEGIPPLMLQQRAEERYDYLAALAVAPSVTLSYPAAVAGRKNHASRWLLEAASVHAGKQVFASDLSEYGSENWLTILTSMQHSLESICDDGSAAGALYADAHDYGLERLHEWRRMGGEPAAHPLAGALALERAMRLVDARNSSAFTEWDGNLAQDADRFADLLYARPLSPTRLESWARCPFQYFLANVLRLSAEEDPEDIYTISALERGSLVHEILERFVNAMRGSMPAPDKAWDDAHRKLLLGIADDAFDEAETRGITGKRLMWTLAKEEMRSDLHAFLDAEAKMRHREGVSPLSAEAKFGLGGAGAWDAAEYTLPDGSQVRFRGAIDRIDQSADGRKALVLDYKTGGSSSYKGLKDDPIDKGKRLQLAIYSLAARQNLPDAGDVRAAYWFVTSRSNFEMLPPEPVNIADDAVDERFAAGMGIIIDGIRGGLFPANPGGIDRWSSNCTYCDFNSLCPSRRQVLWERKSDDRALRDYLRLSNDAVDAADEPRTE